MSCFTISNATTAYNYPNLTCTEGNAVPNATNTRRDTYILIDGKWYQTATTTTSITSSNALVVSELPNTFEAIPYRDLVLPAALIVLCLFGVIMRMFRGVRR